MLRFERVFKAYRQGSTQVQALRGVELRIDQPGFFAVMGPSGSGKSTLLHLAAGLDRADQGTVEVLGEDLGRMNERRLTEFRRVRVGIVFQQFNLITTLSAAQNIALPGVLDRRDKTWIKNRVEALLDQLQLTHRADHRPDALSGGEQQRVAIARALLFHPGLLLADEPTGNLDSASSQRLWRLLADIAREQGMTILMVTHEPVAAAHCRRVYVLHDGQSRGVLEVDELDASGLATRYQQLSR